MHGDVTSSFARRRAAVATRAYRRLARQCKKRKAGAAHSGLVEPRPWEHRPLRQRYHSPLCASRGKAMRKTVTAIAAAAGLLAAVVATPTTADARRGWWGPALGGFAVGAVVGSAFARPYYGYGYYPY